MLFRILFEAGKISINHIFSIPLNHHFAGKNM